MRVRCFKTAQPDNPRDNRIASGSIRLENLPGKAALMKDRADRSVIADFLRDLQETERSRHAAPAIASAKLRSGNRIRGDLCSIFQQHELLIVNADDNATGSFRGAHTCGSEIEERPKAGDGETSWVFLLRIEILSRRKCHFGGGSPKLNLGHH